MRKASLLYDASVHAWVLMTNYIHLLATPATEDGLTQMIQWLEAKYVRYIDHTNAPSGAATVSRGDIQSRWLCVRQS